MDAVEWVQEIQREPEFKELCDGLLRLEVGPLVQIYAGKGADRGIDASYDGTFADVTGRWVFQYKFIHPSTDANRARSRLVRIFIPSGKRTRNAGEFTKPGIQGACGYVLLTNVAVTVHLVERLRAAFMALHPEAKFCIWDPTSLNLLLQDHPHLARSRSQAMEKLCLEQVIEPLWEHVKKSEAMIHRWSEQRNPLWPLQFSAAQQHVATEGFFESYEIRSEWQFICDERSQVPQIDDRILDYAANSAFPHALSDLDRYRAAFQKLFYCISECVHELARSLGEIQGLLSIFSQEERDRMSLGLAYVLMEGAWGFPGQRPTFHSSSISIYGYPIYQGDKAMRAQALLEEYGTALRNQYDRGRRLPDKVSEAREHLRAALHSFADALWYPATIGIDAPRDSLHDESELGEMDD